MQQSVAQLPWGHNLVLLEKLSGPETRRWYASKVIEHNWSRSILEMQIEMRLMERSGKAVTLGILVSIPEKSSLHIRQELLRSIIEQTKQEWADNPGNAS